MKGVWISDVDLPLGRAVADGLRPLGWKQQSAPDNAALRVLVLRSCDEPCASPAGSGPLVILAPAGDRFALSALSLAVQRQAVAAAPACRVNAVAVEGGFEDQAGGSVDWLAGADMVTGQMILLSDEPGPVLTS